jgi:hypothetical protein
MVKYRDPPISGGRSQRNRLPALPQRRRRGMFAGYPEPGFFRMKLVRGGPWVPALIWRPCPIVIPQPLETTPGPEDWCRPLDRSRPLLARIGEREADPFDVWTYGRRIGAAEYHWRLALGKWAQTHAPLDPEANPRARVDLARQPSLF